MSEAQDWYNKLKAKQLEDNESRIKEVLKADTWELQTILALKSCCSALEDKEEHFTFHGKEGQFGFSEKLVNRLMYLAYLYGCKDIEEKSFESGYNACRMAMSKDIEAFQEKYGLNYD